MPDCQPFFKSFARVQICIIYIWLCGCYGKPCLVYLYLMIFEKDNQPTLKLFSLMRTSLRETMSFDGFFHIWIFNNRFISCVINEWNMLDHDIRGIVILTSYRNMLKFERPPKEETYNIYDSECWNKVVTKTTRMILTQLDTLNSLLSCNIEDEIAVHYFHSTSYKVTHCSPVSHFYTLWKRQKTFGFLTFSGGIEMWHWTKMG